MSTLHTPGPWRIYETPASTAHGQASYRLTVSIGTEGMSVADVFNTETPERAANARLIAAAPELLEALRDIASDMGWVPEPRTGLERQMAECALAAIAKVEGVS